MKRKGPFKRAVRRLALAAVLLVILGALGLYLALDRIARQAVEEHTTHALGLSTTVDSVNVHPWGSDVGFSGFRIASPAGFNSPEMLVIPSADVNASLSELRREPIHIKAVTLVHPRLVIESDGSALNLKRMADNMPHPIHHIHLIIDRITVQDATVVLRNLPGLKGETTVPVATFSVDDLGAEEPGGASIKEAVTRLVTALAVHASDSPQMPAEYRALIKGDLVEIVRGAIPGKMGRRLSGLLGKGDAGTPSTRSTTEPTGFFHSFGGLLGRGHPASHPAE